MVLGAAGWSGSGVAGSVGAGRKRPQQAQIPPAGGTRGFGEHRYVALAYTRSRRSAKVVTATYVSRAGACVQRRSPSRIGGRSEEPPRQRTTPGIPTGQLHKAALRPLHGHPVGLGSGGRNDSRPVGAGSRTVFAGLVTLASMARKDPPRSSAVDTPPTDCPAPSAPRTPTACAANAGAPPPTRQP